MGDRGGGGRIKAPDGGRDRIFPFLPPRFRRMTKDQRKNRVKRIKRDSERWTERGIFRLILGLFDRGRLFVWQSFYKSLELESCKPRIDESVTNQGNLEGSKFGIS